MTREFEFVQVDVFTDRVLAGNALAVFLDGRGLDDVQMQDIAREMNLAETTFVLPPSRPDCVAGVRIFTPGREVPFAGHPTVGTAWVLAVEGMVPRGATRFVLDERIGPVPVEVQGDPARPTRVWMQHRDATFGPEVKDRAGIAAALGLAERDLQGGAPIQTGSTGNEFLYVPLRDRQTVDRARLDPVRLEAALAGASALGTFVLAPDPDPAARRVYSRMFAPHAGVPEDPGTGSASGALGAYLVLQGLVKPAPRLTIVSEQGTKMGRQSFVHIELSVTDGRVSDIRVGGGVVPVLRGRLALP
jgi:trans-2,3-dihydro-3-hydroxyanthranilate isomerase